MSSVQFNSRTHMMQEIQSGRWAEKHDLFHSLLPYGHREASPIDVLTAFRDTYDQLGKFQQSFKLEDVRKHDKMKTSTNHHFEALHWSGAWAWTGWESVSAYRYCNPYYTHDKYPVISDRERRLWLIKRTQNMPHWGPTKLANAFGVTPRHVRRLRDEVLENYDRTETRRKFTRTIKTLHEWGVKWKTIARIFGYATCTLRDRFRKEHALDFNPPQNPYRSF